MVIVPQKMPKAHVHPKPNYAAFPYQNSGRIVFDGEIGGVNKLFSLAIMS